MFVKKGSISRYFEYYLSYFETNEFITVLSYCGGQPGFQYFFLVFSLLNSSTPKRFGYIELSLKFSRLASQTNELFKAHLHLEITRPLGSL